jgi:3-oxoacyl-[acyl-carrier protein] reductase
MTNVMTNAVNQSIESGRSLKTVVVAGASRGIGLAVAGHFLPKSDRLITVSRTVAPVGEWIDYRLCGVGVTGHLH